MKTVKKLGKTLGFNDKKGETLKESIAKWVNKYAVDLHRCIAYTFGSNYMVIGGDYLNLGVSSLHRDAKSEMRKIREKYKCSVDDVWVIVCTTKPKNTGLIGLLK